MDENQQNTNEPVNENATCAKCDEYLSGWKRAQADYANLKREADKDKSEFSKYANERLLSDLLPAIDQYEIAMTFTPDFSNLPEDDRKRLTNWVIGLNAVKTIWENAFKDIGLEHVPTDGTFDPMLHEAAGEEESDKPEHAIVRVMQSGWRLNGKLLRPARVIVAKSKNES
jgi:molecular chaperone GrpE